MNTRWWASLIAVAALTAGCPDDEGGGGAGDTMADVAGDTGGGAGGDTGADVGGDTGGDTGGDAGGGDATGDAGGDTGGAPSMGIDEAEEAAVVATVGFDKAVSASISAGPWVFLLFEDKDCDVLDVSDPASPVKRGPIVTDGKVLAVAWDEASGIAYIADATGAVQAIDMSALALAEGAPPSLGKLTVPTLGKDALQLARIGDRLFVLSGSTLQPLAVTRGPSAVSIALEAPVVLPGPATQLVAGGGALFVGDAAGKVSAWKPGQDGKLAKGAEVAVGGDLKGLVAKGSRVIVASKGVGLQVLDFGPSTPALVYESPEVDDVTSIGLFGRTVVLGLEREAVTTLDVSDFGSPRALTTNKGKLPAWIAVTGGTVVFGGGKSGEVAGVPPFVSASIPGPTREAMPRNRLIPVTLSKPVSPATVTPQTVTLKCDGVAVEGDPVLSPEGTTIRFRPLSPLPAGKSCSLDLSGVKDGLGLPVASADDAVTFTTATEAEEAPVVNPGSAWPHTVDGGFTDWVSGVTEHEWYDVTAAKGMYTYFYADFDGESLWILNDWFYNGDAIEPDCYNQFYVYTGGGAEAWDVRAYGDQHVEVRRNGELVDPETEGVEGAAAYGPSPNLDEPHTMYEIRLPAQPGAFWVQLHDPGPSFACTTLEQEPTPMNGQLEAGEGTTTTTIAPPVIADPAPVTLIAPQNGSAAAMPVTLQWALPEGQAGMVQVQVSMSESFTKPDLFIDVLTYATSYPVHEKLLKGAGPWHWRVIAWTTAGSKPSQAWTFSKSGVTELIANPDQASTKAGVPVFIPVLANDVGVELRVIDIIPGAGGSVEIGPDNGVTYTPKQGFTGADTFVYIVQDVNEATAEGTVSVQVQPAAPTEGFVLLDQDLSACCTFTQVITADFDGDGRPDVAAVSNEADAVSVFPNTAAGGLASFGTRIDLDVQSPSAVAAGDLNGDGRPDLVVAHSDMVRVFLSTSGQQVAFSNGQDFPAFGIPQAVAVGDLDGDGVPDVATGNIQGNGVTVLLNRTIEGAVAFTPAPTIQSCYAKKVVIAPISADTRNDLVVVCASVGVLTNLAEPDDAVFAEFYGVGMGPEADVVVAADLNGDNRVDLAVTRPAASAVETVLNVSLPAGLSFKPAAQVLLPSQPRGLVAAELTGGGQVDLAVGLSTGNVLAFIENKTPKASLDLALSVGQQPAIPGFPWSLAAADFDANGHADLAITVESAIEILLNSPLSP